MVAECTIGTMKIGAMYDVTISKMSMMCTLYDVVISTMCEMSTICAMSICRM